MKNKLGLAEEQRLLLRLVPHVQHGDVAADHAPRGPAAAPGRTRRSPRPPTRKSNPSLSISSTPSSASATRRTVVGVSHRLPPRLPLAVGAAMS